MAEDQSALIEVLSRIAANGWRGTASDLLAAFPAAVRPGSAARLARTLGGLGGELSAAGVTVKRLRTPKSGERIIALAVVAVPAQAAPSVDPMAATTGPALPCRRRALMRLRVAAQGSLS